MTSTPLVGTTLFGLDLSKLTLRLKGFRRQVSKRVLLLEFDQRRLRLAEARLLGAGLQFDHVSRFDLPEDALERGVPSEPAKMAGLIQELCREKQIHLHRAAVVLPTEVAFQRLIELPAGLSIEEARALVLDPSSGLQIPITLAQADFDLQPTTLPLLQGDQGAQVPYLLSAVPRNLMDRVLETLQAAQLELQALEIGGHSQLRLMALDLVVLQERDVRLVLELQPDCTHFTLVGASGPFRFERLAAIRDFPEPELSEEQTRSALKEGVAAEQITIHQEGYLDLSELDLRVLVADVREALQRFSRDWPGFHLHDIMLTGLNSAHPMLPELLQAEFGCAVSALEPLLATGVEGWQVDDVLVQKGLNRLLGLGLGLLPSDHLLSSPLPGTAPQRPATGSIPLVDVLPEPEVVGEPVELVETVQEAPAQVEPGTADEEAWPSVGKLPEQPLDDPEEEWPSIGTLQLSESPLPTPEPENSTVQEEEWPSIGKLVLNDAPLPEPSQAPVKENEGLQVLEAAHHEGADSAQVQTSQSPLGELKFSDED